MKNILIAGNWKMNTTPSEAKALTKMIKEGYNTFKNNVEVLVCPPFTSLFAVAEIVSGTEISLGAQNCFHKPSGAFTGEISVPMLAEIGCSYIITGHSERRTIFMETDELINLKAQAIIGAGMKAIVCIGETLEQRQDGETYNVLLNQIQNSLNFSEEYDLSKIVVAYEPVWAIGTGLSADSTQIAEAHGFIRETLINQFGNACKDTLILYGGSVSKDNATSILEIDNVNGALIGGASLKGDVFLDIIKQAQAI